MTVLGGRKNAWNYNGIAGRIPKKMTIVANSITLFRNIPNLPKAQRFSDERTYKHRKHKKKPG
jgi:hypothetical protein